MAEPGSQFLNGSDADSSENESNASWKSDSESTESHDVTDLCKRCSDMFSTMGNLWSLASSDGYVHYNKLQMKESANLGCPFCKHLVKRSLHNDMKPLDPVRFAARKHDMEDVEEGFSQLEGFDRSWVHPFQEWKLWCLAGGTASLGYSENICTFVDSESPAAPFIHGRPTVTKVAGENALSHGRQWLKECLETHASCPKPVTPLLPRRVIDVAGSEGSGLVKLHIRDGLEHANYVALSYCWGGDQPGKTVSSNLEEYITGISVASLPQTIQDAIKITNGIGLRFIWIDAFCIIQDSIEDKVTEIGAMGTVYKDSTVTISATSSSSVHNGFLEERKSLPFFRFPFVLPGGDISTIFLSQFDMHNYHREPLDTRAWCFQESMLAARRLIFGRTELLWSCQTDVLKPIAESPTIYYNFGSKLPPSVYDPSKSTQFTDLERSQLWNNIVDDCTDRAMTVADDRLPAMTGVASELAKLWQDTNIIGLWKKNFVCELAWRAGRQPEFRFDGRRRAPTWSWVSTNGPVTFTEISEPHSVLKNVRLQTFSANGVCDSVENNEVVLEGPTLTIADLPVGYVSKYTFNLQVGVKEKLPVDAILLLLGFNHLDSTSAPSLILRDAGNGTYMRAGLLDSGKGNGFIWKLDAVKHRTVTVV
ncbi:heterokaryon incompatibility protein-domain-containing protein [Tricladium varicosporioides]|nr:heterokaryon incompatibility protein-domain-containing protein [Hymenoscyphus varicosporioides]